MTDQLVLLQLQQLPENLKKEVFDFIGYLFSKYQLAISNGNLPQMLPSDKPKPAFGCGMVKMKISSDFDAELEDFKEYM